VRVRSIELSVLIPTRDRADYLDAALASVRAQFDGEVVVVVDGPEDPATRRVAERHGVLLHVLGRHEGINVARNAAAERASGDLLAFLDDDVTVWPGWAGALTGAAAAHPGAECFGGPIHPRLEGPAPHGCGRAQDAPVTALDLGPRDGGAEFAWGANFAVRREALERIGPFDPTINHCGDEEDWQRRLKRAGGSVRYVARAGVEHRRTGDDARLRNLARAAYERGRAARAYDERKGTAPARGDELRVLAGTLWHVAARGCAAGLVPVAHTLGRITSSSR
jgi:GT2 family glycosyltransferase